MTQKNAPSALIHILRNIPLFKNLDNEDLEIIASRLHKKTYAKGTIVVREGDEGDAMYLVESGQLAVVGQDTSQTIAFIGPGSFVGETSLLLGEPRTATLQVTIDAQLWLLAKKDFESLITTRSAIAKEMLQEIGRRLVKTTHRKRHLVTRRITALSGGYGLELASAIYKQLNMTVALIPLSGAQFSTKARNQEGVMLLDTIAMTESSLAEGLSYQIEVFKHIILLLPQQRDSVVDKAIDLADTIVSIGPPPDWLKKYETKEDLWITTSSKVDLARMARRLTNRTVGLALSSGGSRGLAHVGVIKVLLEENIPIDLIAGTSGGALFGTLFAAGWSFEQIYLYSHDLKRVTNLPNWDFNFPPKTGIVKGRRAYNKFLVQRLQNISFDNLKIPLYIVAADILTGEEVVFNSGSIPDAIRASVSLPILADPWHYQGRYFLDGGIVNPVPASTLRKHGADIVIASSVIQPLAKSFSGPKNKMPNIRQTIFNIFSAMEAEVVKKQLPLIDVLIQHNVSARFTFDFEHLDETIQFGEQVARQMLPEIKKIIESPAEI